jgi:hypothetical protein
LSHHSSTLVTAPKIPVTTTNTTTTTATATTNQKISSINSRLNANVNGNDKDLGNSSVAMRRRSSVRSVDIDNGLEAVKFAGARHQEPRDSIVSNLSGVSGVSGDTMTSTGTEKVRVASLNYSLVIGSRNILRRKFFAR